MARAMYTNIASVVFQLSSKVNYVKLLCISYNLIIDKTITDYIFKELDIYSSFKPSLLNYSRMYIPILVWLSYIYSWSLVLMVSTDFCYFSYPSLIKRYTILLNQEHYTGNLLTLYIWHYLIEFQITEKMQIISFVIGLVQLL